jgi:hypothetical protein
MEDEWTYYHEQTATLRNDKVVKNQGEEREEEQIEVSQEPHQEKEERTKISSTLALIPEVSRGQEISLLLNEQIEDIKMELLENFPYIITVHDSLPDEKLIEKT